MVTKLLRNLVFDVLSIALELMMHMESHAYVVLNGEFDVGSAVFCSTGQTEGEQGVISA